MSEFPGSINEFLDFMADTVTIYAWTGQSVSGVPSYSVSGTTYTCRVELANHLIVDAQGREVLARGRIIMGTTTTIGIKDKIVLPAEYIPTSPPILAVNVEPDENGNHHVTLEIG